jgi:hypothetical protein
MAAFLTWQILRPPIASMQPQRSRKSAEKKATAKTAADALRVRLISLKSIGPPGDQED